MECKLLFIHGEQETGQHELIDTLWNVNKVITLSGTLSYTELIDTLWNVNIKSK